MTHLGDLHRNHPFYRGDPLDPVSIAVAPNPQVVLTAQKRHDFEFEEFLNDPLCTQGQQFRHNGTVTVDSPGEKLLNLLGWWYSRQRSELLDGCRRNSIVAQAFLFLHVCWESSPHAAANREPPGLMPLPRTGAQWSRPAVPPVGMP